MNFGKEGAEIRTCKGSDKSNLGEDFIVMWDDEGVPIHIHKKIVEYLYEQIKGDLKTEIPLVNDSPFIV